MLQKLNDLIASTNPKQIGGALKKDSALRDWVIDATKDLSNRVSLSERLYLLINGLNLNQCQRGNKKKFISITKGYGFCGRTRDCECAAQSVSMKVSTAKQDYSSEKKTAINEKRLRTNLEKYGVTNVGQTSKARSNHHQFYQDDSKVITTLAKMQRTMLNRHGAINPQQVEEIKTRSRKTLLERYGVDNINKTAASKERLSKQSKATWKLRKENNFDYHRLNDKFRSVCNVEFITTSENYKGAMGNIWYEFTCLKCNSVFDTWISCGHLPICKTCNPTRPHFKSGEENEVFDYLIAIGVDAKQRDRKLIYPMELDIVCHDQKIAVEYCGLYWHSELSQGKTKDYHLKKMLACEAKGYRLITIFSDEWNIKKHIVKTKLAAVFGKLSTHIGARACEIVKLDSAAAMNFYDQHHLQGKAGAEIHLGLMHDSEIVAAMSFGKPRTFIKNSNLKHQYELIRYATSCHVRGGAGKLLKHFELTHHPKSIISYADARWSSGGMYLALGFNQMDIKINPGYWYTGDYTNREHRFGYTKASLVKAGHDQNLSEWEIMQSLGYDRIWDCGQLRYEKLY